MLNIVGALILCIWLLSMCSTEPDTQKASSLSGASQESYLDARVQDNTQMMEYAKLDHESLKLLSVSYSIDPDYVPTKAGYIYDMPDGVTVVCTRGITNDIFIYDCNNHSYTLNDLSQNALTTAIQKKLSDLSYDAGPADGAFGSKTEAAIREYQEATHKVVDGLPTVSLLESLLVAK